MFHVGQHVIRVVPFNADESLGEAVPVVGRVYTVRAIRRNEDNRLGILLEEIVNEPRQYREGLGEKHFAASRFRPLDDTRLAVFRQHLATKPADVEPVS